MKKIGIAILFLLLAGVLLFFLVPAPHSVTRTVALPASQDAAFRCFTNGKLLQRWWHAPDSNTISQSLDVTDGDLRFHFTPKAFDIVSVHIEGGATPVQSFITVLPSGRDSVFVSWKADLDSGLSKMQRYRFSKKLERSMADALARLQGFAQQEANIYGMPIHREMVTDTLLVVTKQRDTARPQPATYYGLIKKLRDYVAAQGAQETNYPMLNIAAGDGWYETMVAIPVNRALPGSGPIEAKRMVPGKILMAEVRGGPAQVEEGLNQLDFYANEHRLIPPALPFQSLRTDRTAEPDTSKWITRLYYPIL